MISSRVLTIEQIESLGGYEVIYADPAWSYNDRGINGAADKHYPTLSLSDLKALPVARVAAKNAVLFLWACNPLLPEAMAVIEAWGFKFKTVAFTWVKTLADGRPSFGLGRWTRGSVEPCLLAIRGAPHFMVQNRSVRQVVLDSWEPEEFASFSVGVHSRKPAEVRTRIETLLGPRSTLELFAWERTPGWDVWGNEVDSDIDLFEDPGARGVMNEIVSN